MITPREFGAVTQDKIVVVKQAISGQLATRALGSATNKLTTGAITPERYLKFVNRARSWAPTHEKLLGQALRAQNSAQPKVFKSLAPIFGAPRELPPAISQTYQQFAKTVAAKNPAFNGLAGRTPDVVRPPQVRSSYDAWSRTFNNITRGPFGNKTPNLTTRTLQSPFAFGAAVMERLVEPNAAYNHGGRGVVRSYIHGPNLRYPHALFHELGHAIDLGPAQRSGSTLRKEVMANRYGSQLYRNYLQNMPAAEAARLPTPKQLLQARHLSMDTYRTQRLKELLDRAHSVVAEQRQVFSTSGEGSVINKLLRQLSDYSMANGAR